MKKVFCLTLLTFCLVGCTKFKEIQMDNDADKLIEASQNSSLVNMTEYVIVGQALEQKYQGDDRTKFMKIVCWKVKQKMRVGEKCGLLELMFIGDQWKGSYE